MLTSQDAQPGPGAEGPQEPVELLGRGRLGETWSSREPGGQRLAAKRLRLPEASPSTVESLRPLTLLRHPTLVPVEQVLTAGNEVWVRSELDPGVPLHRLLVVAALTATQAALITEGILQGMDALAEAGFAHGNLHANNVHVGPRGQVRIGDGGVLPLLRAGEAGTWAERDAAAVAKLLGRVAGQDGGRQTAPDWRSPAAGALVEAAGAVRRSCGPETVAALRRAAAQMLEEGARERTAGEVAALVRAVAPVSRPERPAPPPEPAPAPPLAPAPAPAPALAPAAAAAVRFALSWLAKRRRLLGVVLALAVCLPALWLAAGWLGGLGHRPAAVARGAPAPRPTAAPAEAAPAPNVVAAPALRPVPELAPRQSGPIGAVEISPLGSGCSAGADCALRVSISLQPSDSSRPLAWTFKVFDRCSGATTELAGVQMTAGPGWNLAYGTSYPSLPGGRALAVVAVTSAPAQAASPPLLLPAGESTC